MVTSREFKYTTVSYGDIDVCWRMGLEGGGRSFGQSFLPVTEHLFGRVGRAFELCAGAGCIGFSLLARGLCDSLVLSDINPQAVAAARETVRRNGLEDRVTVYQSDGVADIPEDERCDLFIANPPFFIEGRTPSMRDDWVSPETALRAHDPELRLHRDLYAGMARFLEPGGSVLFQETALATSPELFMSMIEAGGLQHVRTIWHTENRRFPGIYFLWSKLAAPTIIFDEGHETITTVTLELRDEPQEPLVVPTRGVYAFRLRNRTGRALTPKADLSASSPAQVERALVEIPPGGELELPPLTIGAGKSIAFHEEASGTALAKVTASS